MNIFGVRNWVGAAVQGAISWIAYLVQSGFSRSDIIQKIGSRFVVGPEGLDAITPSLSSQDAANLYTRGRRAAVAGLELSAMEGNFILPESSIPTDPDLRPGVYQYQVRALWVDDQGKQQGFQLPVTSYRQLTRDQVIDQFERGALDYAVQHHCPSEFDPRDMRGNTEIDIIFIRKGGNYA